MRGLTAGLSALLFWLGQASVLALVLILVVGVPYSFKTAKFVAADSIEGRSTYDAERVSIIDEPDHVDPPFGRGESVFLSLVNYKRGYDGNRTSDTGFQPESFWNDVVAMLAHKGGPHQQRAVIALERAIAPDYSGVRPATIHYLELNPQLFAGLWLFLKFYPADAQARAMSLDESRARDFCLFFDGRPLLPSEEGVARPDCTQDELEEHRWRVPGLVFGIFLPCGSFFLGAYSTQRFEQRRLHDFPSGARIQRFEQRGLCGLKGGKGDGWFLLSLLSAFGVFCGGALMLIAPRIF